MYNETLAESADLGEGVEVGGEITVTVVDVAPVGDDTVALRVTVPLAADGFEVDVFADLVAVRVGRSLSFMYFASQATPTDAGTIDEYTALAASRLPIGTSDAPATTDASETTEAASNEPSFTIESGYTTSGTLPAQPT